MDRRNLSGILLGWMLVCLGIPFQPVFSQELVSEPIQGHTTADRIQIWAMVKDAKFVEFQLEPESGVGGEPQYFSASTVGENNWQGNTPIEASFTKLQPNASYRLSVKMDDRLWERTWTVRTLSKIPGDSLSFMVGSCAMYGLGMMRMVRPGTFTDIFDAMIPIRTDFNVWLGDNVYLLFNEWESVARTYEKYTKVRLEEHFNAFLRSRPQYAILDDHDFGPDNSDSGFENKDMTSTCFRQFWPNPPAPKEAGKSNFSSFSQGDCDFFLLDGRYFRIADGFTQMYGEAQMNWLKKSLLASKATFKFIATGSQSLSTVNYGETWEDYAEQKEFIQWIKENKVEGIVFLSGDRHFTELMKVEQPGAYPLYEFTNSPLTSILRKKPLDKDDPEHDSPIRVPGTLTVDHNFGVLTVAGPPESRVLTIQTMDAQGKELWKYEIPAAELKF